MSPVESCAINALLCILPCSPPPPLAFFLCFSIFLFEKVRRDSFFFLSSFFLSVLLSFFSLSLLSLSLPPSLSLSQYRYAQIVARA